MSRPLPLAALLLAVLATVLAGVALAGCMGGDPSREDFESQVRDSRDRTDFALSHVTRATTYDELLERLDIASVEASGAANDIAEVGAPGDLESEAEELVEALRALSGELSATGEALDDPQFQGSTVQGLEFENWERVQAALGELRELGVDVQPLARHGPGDA